MDAIVVTDPKGVMHVFGPYDDAEEAVREIDRLVAAGLRVGSQYKIGLASFADPSEVHFLVQGVSHDHL